MKNPKYKRKMPLRQKLGMPWNFPCGHSGIIPDRAGESNSFVIWSSTPSHQRGGRWHCRVCRENNRKGLGRKGLVAKMVYRVGRARYEAKKNGWAIPSITAEDALAMWKRQGDKCAACGVGLSFLSRYCLDHNHETGVVRGFLCNNCNVAEGFLKDYTPERFAAFCKYRELIGASIT